MSLGLGTLIPLLILSPSLIYLLGVRTSRGVLETSDVFETHTQELLTLAFVSLLVMVLTSSLFWFANEPAAISEFKSIWDLTEPSHGEPDLGKIVLAIKPIILFFGCAYLISFIIGFITPGISFRLLEKNNESSLRTLLHRIKDNEIVFVWVLTNTSHRGKQLMYQGMVRSVSLQGRSISSITLSVPTKTYLSFENALETSHVVKMGSLPPKTLPRDISATGTTNPNCFCIPGQNIANVYFEKAIAGPPSTLRTQLADMMQRLTDLVRG